MYLKFTRLDGNPIWINSAFIVTVEPRRGGGSIVVPIGDGLDYDVRETCEKVLAMLGAAPAPEVAVVPVPAPKGLAPKAPDDVSPETGKGDCGGEDAAAPDAADPKQNNLKSAEEERGGGVPAPAVTEEPPKKRGRKPRVAKAAPAEKPAPAPVTDLTDDQIARLRKMAPRSVKKLVNTLQSQFGVADTEAALLVLTAKGHCSVERDRVLWAPASAGER